MPTAFSFSQELTETMHYSLDSQSETAGRVPELAGFTLMQQSRRMQQRPLSLQGVELADGKRFFVNLGSQAETCARPVMFAPVQNSEEKPMMTVNSTITLDAARHADAALTERTFAWDFRAQRVDALLERDFAWPALDESEYRRPTSTQTVQTVRIWSKERSYSRIPALAPKKHPAADAESLRELLQEAMERESQRITLRTGAFKSDDEERSGGLENSSRVSLLAAVKNFFRRLSANCAQLGKNCARA